MQYLFEYLKYDKETGNFYWIKSPANCIDINQTPGFIDSRGYISIRFKRKNYYSHRLAWYMTYGVWPKIIDHINGNRSDNRLCNLRNVTIRINNINTKHHRQGRLVGVVWRPLRNRWYSQIRINKKNIHLGSFKTQEEAHQAYMNKLKELNYV